MPPMSLPEFSGVTAEHLFHAMRMCEKGEGDEVLAQFEREFAVKCGSKHVLSASSATSGLHLALMALNVKEGDEVLCPTFTFAASAFPIMYQKAVPVFIDSENETWNMSPAYLEVAIRDRLQKGKSLKAVVVVHGYGTPANLDQLLGVASKYSIPVIEDAANALGSTWKSNQVGTLGQIGVFSFNRNKIISAAAGGCVVTNDASLANRMMYLAHQAKSPTPYYQHETVGYNYGLSPILAEIVRVQLPSLVSRIEKRRTVFQEYLKQCQGKVLVQNELDQAFANRWLTVLRPNENKAPIAPFTESRKVWKPMHLQPVFEHMPYYGNQESTSFFEQAICLPFRGEPVSIDQ